MERSGEGHHPLRVLLVEDSDDDAALLGRELRRQGFDYTAVRVETASEMAAALAAGEHDIVIADYSLPQFSGPAAIEVLQGSELDIPLLIVSGSIGEDAAVAALKAGAQDFITKGSFSRLGPAIRRELSEAESRARRRQAERSWAASEQRFATAFHLNPSGMVILDTTGRIVDANRAFVEITGFDPASSGGQTPAHLGAWVEDSEGQRLLGLALADGLHDVEAVIRRSDGGVRTVLASAQSVVLDDDKAILVSFADISARQQAEAALAAAHAELAGAYETTLVGWARALELRDAETQGHSNRVTEMTVRMAARAGFGAEELVHIRRGALLHDIGKMGVPDAVLLKPGPLTDEEWTLMRRHPRYAYDMLSAIEFLRPALQIPLSHHERWDGRGYPDGLDGEQIPLAARLFAVVDVWDALSSPRPYKEAWPADRVMAQIRESSGTHFDPQAVEVFEATLGEAA